MLLAAFPSPSAPPPLSSKKKKKSNAEPPVTKKEGDEATVPPITITSDEVNFLVYRYLQESGFVHSR